MINNVLGNFLSAPFITIQLRPFIAVHRYVAIFLKPPDSIDFLEHGNSWCVEMFMFLSDSLGTLNKRSALLLCHIKMQRLIYFQTNTGA